MSEVLRQESQRLDRVKSDFLGSVSHEMRSPLHQTLGKLEMLLQTDCSDEQRELTFNARFGATQLLETIDKILQYTRISSEPDMKSNLALEKNESREDDNLPQLIGPRIGHGAGVASTVDLVILCEDVVEDTTKRMRLLETILTPVNEIEQNEPQWSDSAELQRASTEKDPFTIVLFDAKPIHGLRIPTTSGYRVILENLLV